MSRHVALACCSAALVVVACQKPSPPPAPVVEQVVAFDQARLLAGELPPGAESDLLLSKCQICHTHEVVTLQRLTPKQWEGTVKKMRGWGAPIDDDEERRLVAYLGRHFTAELAERRSPVVAPPEGALPEETP